MAYRSRGRRRTTRGRSRRRSSKRITNYRMSRGGIRM